MDYPVQPLSALVGKVGRGGDQPSFGALIDFSRDRNRGVAGLGVGVDGAVFGTILIDAARSLVCDLTPLGGAKQTETLPSAFADALARNGWLIGMTVTIRPAELQVELGAGDPAAPVRHTFAIPLDTTLRATLLTRPLAVLARGGYHGVTPYLDVVRQPTPDLSHPRAPNRQYNPGDSLLSTLTRVTWLLRNHAPASLQASLQSLRTAAAQDYVDQQKAYFNFFDGRQALLDDIRQVGTWSEPVEEAVARLASLQP